MRYFIHFAAALTVCLSMSLAVAQDRVVVIPLNSAKELNNVVTVSATGGDFTDPVAAVNSINDASAAKPYLVLIGPGVYTLTQTLVMKPFVTISGSERNATTLTGAISSGGATTSTVISGADNATLRSLTVENTGGGTNSIALLNDGSVPVIQDVTARASGGSGTNAGVVNINSPPFPSPQIIMTDITAEASGGTVCVGVYNASSSPAMTNVAASGSGGSAGSMGVSNINGASPFMTNVTAFAYGSAGQNVGLYNSDAASNPAIRNSFIVAVDGTPYAIRVDSGTVRVFHSSILGNIFSDPIANNLKCFFSDNGTLNLRDADCQLLPTPWP